MYFHQYCYNRLTYFWIKKLHYVKVCIYNHSWPEICKFRGNIFNIIMLICQNMVSVSEPSLFLICYSCSAMVLARVVCGSLCPTCRRCLPYNHRIFIDTSEQLNLVCLHTSVHFRTQTIRNLCLSTGGNLHTSPDKTKWATFIG